MRPYRRRKKQTKGNYAFIDSQNLNLGTQKMGWKMDWRKFRQFLRDTYGVTHAYMFIGYMAENEQLYEHMHELGYLIVLKPTIDMKVLPEAESEATENHDAAKVEKEKPTVKGNIDADLVLHAMKELPNYNKAIIVSGDGDFFGLIEYLVAQNKLLHIMTPNWQYSSLLKQFEEYIVRLDVRKNELRYHDRHTRKK
ncbi:MAG TPA: NYN domain-containing protein [Candidatus Saccharimonadales bacterium]|nr:NYN domain-containing protein [Candidatus Saccharimonadales bacterium]